MLSQCYLDDMLPVLFCYIPLNDTWIDAVQMVLQMQIDVNPDINAYCETALEYADAAEV